MEQQKITVPGTLDSLGTIAKRVMEAAKDAGLDKKKAYKLRLAVDEIATNIVTHGYEEAGKNGDIDLEVAVNEQALTIILSDTGVEFDPTQKTPQDDLHLPIEERDMGGLGVHLAMDSVDELKYKREGENNYNIFIVNRIQ